MMREIEHTAGFRKKTATDAREPPWWSNYIRTVAEREHKILKNFWKKE